MIKRTLYKTLQEWKNEKNRRPLLIRGARQIGKTFLLNAFGNNEFKSFISLNFERNPEYKEIFTTYNPLEIIERITLFTGKKVKEGESLIFLDEIQDCPKAIMALRYFYEEMPDLHIVGAGSLLEFTLKAEDLRIPVGRIQYIYMFPLSFGEFLNALGEEALYEHILDLSNLSKLPEALHHKLVEYVRKFFILGGMPAVVNEYIQTRDILKCQKIQHSIISTYRDDFSKYARESKFNYLRKVFNSVPSMVGDKFVYAKVDNSMKSRDLKAAVELLETAGVVYRVKRSSGAGLPLEAGVKENLFKMIFLDIGLMQAINGIYSETIKEKDLTAIFKGALAEQFSGQEMIASQEPYIKPQLYYWGREAKSSNAEVDYLVEKNEKVIPIEIKSGSSGHLKSMNMFLKTYNTDYGVKISQAGYKREENIISLPFYGISSFFKDNTNS